MSDFYQFYGTLYHLTNGKMHRFIVSFPDKNNEDDWSGVARSH